ncbi:MAG: YbhB/YbcL family Raf kinase inhibitor-like protein [Byssovorax sp.]
MKARIALVALTIGFSSAAACSSGDTATATGTSSTGDSTTSVSSGSGTGGAGGAGSSTSAAGTGGGTTAASSSATSASSTSSGAGGMAAFALVSTGFSEGMEIPKTYACGGANTSPDLSWAPTPAGTLSYAVRLTDKSNNLIHWVIWDIPAATTGLPAGVEKKANPAIPAGSKQAKAYDNQTFGYLGPCPGKVHTYEFAVIALDVATLPNVTTASTRNQVNVEILNHDLATATLTGTYTP